jgi:hypothetical protein
MSSPTFSRGRCGLEVPAVPASSAPPKARSTRQGHPEPIKDATPCPNPFHQTVAITLCSSASPPLTLACATMSISPFAALQSPRRSPGAAQEGEEDVGVACSSSRASSRRNDLVGVVPPLRSAPASRSPSPPHLRQQRHPRSLHHCALYLLVPSACSGEDPSLILSRAGESAAAYRHSPSGRRRPRACVRLQPSNQDPTFPYSI